MSEIVRVFVLCLQVFQYSSVMLLAYYKDSLSKESTNMLQNIRSSASISRRGFRLLKSLNHIANIATIVEHMLSDNCKNVVESMFSMIYEASLAALYYYDNYVFLSRLGIFTHTEKENKEFYKKSLISWCVGECFKFASILYKHQLQWKELKMLRAEQKVRTSTTAEACLQEEVQRLESEISAHYFQYIKVYCGVCFESLLTSHNIFYFAFNRHCAT